MSEPTHPRVPDIYDPRQRDMSVSRRPQNRRDEGWIAELLLQERIARVATLWQADDGEAFPFVTPLAYAYRPERRDIVYHTNITGRLRANTGQGHRATLEVSQIGQLLPSNSPLELSVQYRSVIVFGRAHRLTDPQEAREALTTLTERCFPDLRVGVQTRPITDADLKRTSVYALKIEHWSGKENWAPAATQEDSWPALTPALARLRPAVGPAHG